MVTSTLKAVTKQLGTTFGSPYQYYIEDVEQDLKKPCFTVDVLNPLQRSISPVIYKRTMPMVIHLFLGDCKDIKKKYYEMGEQIVECLEYLPFLGGLLRGEDISWQIVDDVLQVFVTYRFITRKSETPGMMETLAQNISSN